MRFPAIPADERAGLIRLAQLAPSQVQELVSGLGKAPAVLDREEFLKGIDMPAGLDTVDLRAIVWALMYLTSYLVFGDIDEESFLAELIGSLLTGGADKATADRLSEILPPLLQVESLSLRAKAVDLQVDHANVFQSTRILTDLRPVFAIDSVSDVRGLLISHTLKIEYYHDEGTKEIFISLDDRDLSELRKSLERAEAKARTLKQLIADRLSLPDFGSADVEY